MPFPPQKNDHGSDNNGPNVSNDHKPNPAHNAPASGNHKDAMRKEGMSPNDAHTNHGDGHH